MYKIKIYSILLTKKNNVRKIYNLFTKNGNLMCTYENAVKVHNRHFRDLKYLFVFSQFNGVNFVTQPGYQNYNEGIIKAKI